MPHDEYITKSLPRVISPFLKFNNKMRKCGWWRSLPHTCHALCFCADFTVCVWAYLDFVYVYHENLWVIFERGWDTVCTSKIASEKLSVDVDTPMDFLLRRNRRQLYIIDGCMWNGMIEVFLYLPYINPTQYIDTKKMLDRLDNFKCKICRSKYMLRCIRM